LEWEQYENKTGMVSLPRPVMAELFEKINDNELLIMAQTVGKKAMLDVALFMDKITDLDLAQILRNLLSIGQVLYISKFQMWAIKNHIQTLILRYTTVQITQDLIKRVQQA
jgi:hypothetical protein